MRTALSPALRGRPPTGLGTTNGWRAELPASRVAQLFTSGLGGRQVARIGPATGGAQPGSKFQACWTPGWARTLALALAVGVSHAEELTPDRMAAARKIYEAKCAKCHRFYEPSNYAEPDWRRWMSAMSRKARLKPDQDALLNRFLDAYRAGQVVSLPGSHQK